MIVLIGNNPHLQTINVTVSTYQRETFEL